MVAQPKEKDVAAQNGRRPVKPPTGGYRRLKIPWGWVFAAAAVLLIGYNLVEAKIHAVQPLPEGLIQANGRIEGDHVIISSKFPGRLGLLAAREGSTVTKGELLMRIDDPQLTAKRDQAAATLASAIASADSAGTNVDLVRATGSGAILQAQGLVAQAESAIGSAHSDLDRAKANVDSARAAESVASLGVSVAESQLAAAKANRARAIAGQNGAKSGLAAARASLAAARANAEAARAASEQADREATRYTNLQHEGAVSLEIAERARTAAAQAKAAFDASEHEVEAAQSGVDARITDLDAANQAVTVAGEALKQASDQVAAARHQALAAKAAVKQSVAQRAGYEHGVAESEARKTQAQGQLDQALTANTQVRMTEKNQTSAEAKIKEARAALAEIESMMDEMSVKAPTAGTVITRFQDQGELVSAGSPILELVDLDRLYLKVYVPENMIGKVRLGLPARIYTDAFPNEPFAAKVGYISAEAEFTPKDIQTSAERVSLVYAVRLYLESNPGHRLTPGLPADAIIQWKPETPWQRPR
ncbi:MAG TPA: efflux RND transporter periplasmic adaptor subunit [Fimbriimonadaceae bacterium]|nr:efflux RND transporter periplasmic adaptor subunit [Fimbriimonadaceae bacterium]